MLALTDVRSDSWHRMYNAINADRTHHISYIVYHKYVKRMSLFHLKSLCKVILLSYHFLSPLGGRWDDFDIALEAHHDIIEAQKSVLKTYLEEEEIAINVDIDKFAAKWKQLKPSDTSLSASSGGNGAKASGGAANGAFDAQSIQKIFDSLDDWKAQFAVLEARTVKHSEGRAAFNMSPGKQTMSSLYTCYRACKVAL